MKYFFIFYFSEFIFFVSLSLERAIIPSAEVPFLVLLEINEALCSSCTMNPEKFQVRQENMMTSAFRRGMFFISSLQGFLRTSWWRCGYRSTLLHYNRSFLVLEGQKNENNENKETFHAIGNCAASEYKRKSTDFGS